MDNLIINYNEYVSLFEMPTRFRFIDDLSEDEKELYEQIRGRDNIVALRRKLIELIDDDLQYEFKKILNSWEMYGISTCEIDPVHHQRFKHFYDEVMENHAVKKEAYHKVDFTAQKITCLITDERCLAEKLTPLQIFKAAYQLGDVPAVANFRFMYNSADKTDGKYREWMFHFDNSNYAAEFKLITTRLAGSSFANTEQCLAAFPYDTSQVIRFTQCEAATKFVNMDELEREFCGVPGAAYAVIKNKPNCAPIETGLRTEMILHHRSATASKDNGDCRDSELMTFHGIARCRPFLTQEELAGAPHLTPLQHFVLGGFKRQASDMFFSAFEQHRGELNQQIRNLLLQGRNRQLADFIIAEFHQQGVSILQESLYQKQKVTYDNLAEIIHKLPKLKADENIRDNLYQIIINLMNLDQNAALKPDCSENLIFPARTQLRERKREDFLMPIEEDISEIIFSSQSIYLIPLSELMKISSILEEIYRKLGVMMPDNTDLALFKSRSALANDYVSQLHERIYSAETHQTIVLFLYYMLHDLKSIQRVSYQEILPYPNWIQRIKRKILQHFVSYRMIMDQQ
ncbi:hypothetical protein ACR71G_16255 [Xenorhabdus bovienii]|uniref:hypothetical protein n=1 Tax=Xenorhabdus bovienii TaxID=40576 RepID=UPI003DA2A919